MFRDTVVDEVREIREAYSKEFGDDVTAIIRDLRRFAAQSDRVHVSFPPKPAAPQHSVAKGSPATRRKAEQHDPSHS